MSLFDEIGQLVGGVGGQDSGPVGHIMSLVNNPETGGLQGLIQQFQSNGLGDVVSSWVGSGANQGISADQIEQVIGQDKINELAGKIGIQPDQVSSLLAQHLPGVVGKMTPDGNAPAS